MAFAEYDVVIERDAMSVYSFLLDPGHLTQWREGVRSVRLVSGTAGVRGAVYRQVSTGPAGCPVENDFEITEVRSGAEIQYQVIDGPVRPHGGYYLSTEGSRTRVRFALDDEDRGLVARLRNAFRPRLAAEVSQLERLKAVLETRQAA